MSEANNTLQLAETLFIFDSVSILTRCQLESF
jgi:hypothetical protein